MVSHSDHHTPLLEDLNMLIGEPEMHAVNFDPKEARRKGQANVPLTVSPVPQLPGQTLSALDLIKSRVAAKQSKDHVAALATYRPLVRKLADGTYLTATEVEA
ncbi:MAG: hypothetical protein C0467_32715, partial [Planctomycetaceae bacterium]|nr:hypothetical protein [Planctomycetaceae bacterium]